MTSVFSTPFNLAYGELLERSRAEAIKARQTEPLENAIQSVRDIREAGSNGITPATLKTSAPENLKKAVGLTELINRKLKGLRIIENAIDDLQAKPDSDPEKRKELEYQVKRKKFLFDKLSAEATLLAETLHNTKNAKEFFVNTAKGSTFINEAYSLYEAVEAGKKEEILEVKPWAGPYGIHHLTLDKDSPQGLHRVQECIANANKHLAEMDKILTELKALRGKPKNENTQKEFSSLNDKLKILEEELRKEALIMIKSLKSPHLHPFFADEDEGKNLMAQINLLRTKLYATHFGKSRWANWFNNPTLTDKKWSKLTDDFESLRKKAENPEDCIVFTREKGGFFSKQHTNINLNLKEIFRTVDFMKNAERYIALWKDKLEELKKDPGNAELQKYAKFEPLLRHLETCQQKGFIGLEKMNVTENIFDSGLTIHCGNPQGKEAMLQTMVLYTSIVAEEKKENKATFGAELGEQPDLEDVEKLDDEEDDSPRPT